MERAGSQQGPESNVDVVVEVRLILGEVRAHSGLRIRIFASGNEMASPVEC